VRQAKLVSCPNCPPIFPPNFQPFFEKSSLCITEPSRKVMTFANYRKDISTFPAVFAL